MVNKHLLNILPFLELRNHDTGGCGNFNVKKLRPRWWFLARTPAIGMRLSAKWRIGETITLAKAFDGLGIKSDGNCPVTSIEHDSFDDTREQIASGGCVKDGPSCGKLTGLLLLFCSKSPVCLPAFGITQQIEHILFNFARRHRHAAAGWPATGMGAAAEVVGVLSASVYESY